MKVFIIACLMLVTSASCSYEDLRFYVREWLGGLGEGTYYVTDENCKPIAKLVCVKNMNVVGGLECKFKPGE